MDLLMLTHVCHNHNRQHRVQVDFSWVMYNQRQSSKTVMDLQCHCRVYKQLKDKFLQSIQYTNYPIHDVEFSSFGDKGSVVLSNGIQIYNYIVPAVNFDYNPHPTLFLDVEIIEVSAGQKLAELDRMVSECKNALKTDKAWRALKDTAIAEEQLTLRELIEKQQKEIQTLQNEMETVKQDNERRHKQDQTAEAEIHKNILCDECDDNVIGHRFKCTVCYDYDLCQKCEAKGLHSHHIMIRMVKPRFTKTGVDTIDARLLPLTERKTIDFGTQPANMPTNEDSAGLPHSNTIQESSSKVEPPKPQNRIIGDRLPSCLCPVKKYDPSTINVPKKLPFEATDFEMKMVPSHNHPAVPAWRWSMPYRAPGKFGTFGDAKIDAKETKEEEMSLEQVIDIMNKKIVEKEDPENIEYWRHFFAMKKGEELNIEDDGDSDETGSTCSSESDSFDALSDDLNETEESESSSEQSEREGSESDNDFDVVEHEEDEMKK